jgi:hypothetical protein
VQLGLYASNNLLSRPDAQLRTLCIQGLNTLQASTETMVDQIKAHPTEHMFGCGPLSWLCNQFEGVPP